MRRKEMRDDAGEAQNEGTLPETRTGERCGRAEGLEREAEFGATEHSPTEAEANERVWRKEVRDNAGEAQNEGTLPETHTEERCGRAEDLELEAEFGSTEHTPDMYEYKVWAKAESRKAKERARIDTNYYINKTYTRDKKNGSEHRVRDGEGVWI